MQAVSRDSGDSSMAYQNHFGLLYFRCSVCYAVRMTAPISIYIHVPFCKKRCYYCDFNTLAGKDRYIASYFEALKLEILQVAGQLTDSEVVHSVYLGGGTPSYVDVAYILDVMSVLRENFKLTTDCEITIEANPGTLSKEKLNSYRQAGINRISLGVQTADDNELQQLGRIHTFQDVVETVDLARRDGFTNISVDLIFGLPNQTVNGWMDTLEKTVSLEIEHISVYALTIEEGTPFGSWHEKGELPIPDDDQLADEYAAAQSWLAAQGFDQYEISNWAKRDNQRDLRSRHNMQYWLNLPYLGFGLGAHSCFYGQRLANTTSLGQYIQSCQKPQRSPSKLFPACVEVTTIEPYTEMQETMMLGLRLIRQGVSKQVFYDRFGQHMEDVFNHEIGALLQQGLVRWQDEDQLVLTDHGVFVGNQAFVYFV